MIRQHFYVRNYWEVVIFYDLDYDYFYFVYQEMRDKGFSHEFVERVYRNMHSGKAKAVTCSDLGKCVSIVLFNKHQSVGDYVDSLVHEAEHIKQAMLAAYQVKDAGEPPAYTIGYLVMRMWEVFGRILS